MRRGPQPGELATSPLLFGGWGSEPLGVDNKISNSAQVGAWATQALPSSGIRTASELGTKSEVAHKLYDWLHTPCASLVIFPPNRPPTGVGAYLYVDDLRVIIP